MFSSPESILNLEVTTQAKRAVVFPSVLGHIRISYRYRDSQGVLSNTKELSSFLFWQKQVNYLQKCFFCVLVEQLQEIHEKGSVWKCNQREGGEDVWERSEKHITVSRNFSPVYPSIKRVPQICSQLIRRARRLPSTPHQSLSLVTTGVPPTATSYIFSCRRRFVRATQHKQSQQRTQSQRKKTFNEYCTEIVGWPTNFLQRFGKNIWKRTKTQESDTLLMRIAKSV